MKLFLSGVWVCFVTILSSYMSVSWQAGAKESAAEPLLFQGLDYEKTRVINVPMIADGAVQGYVVAQFVFTADAATLKQLSVPPEVFVADAAFRTLYADESLDFNNLQKYDLTALTGAITKSVNERFATEILKEVLVEEFNYVAKSEMSR